MLAIVPLLFLFFLPGCASIVSKSNYPIMITSTPSDAEVTVSNRHGRIFASGITPLNVTLKSSDGFFARADYLLTFRKPGYSEMIVPLNSKIDGWYFGNILLGGLIGMLIIDPATGAMWRLETDYVHVNLNGGSSPGLVVMELKDADEDTKAKMVRIQ